jgi:hypothetical protein
MTKYDIKWNRMYKYAEIYSKKNGNLEVPRKFRTNDGYTYDDQGVVQLGRWIYLQRCVCKPDSERGKLLLRIGMRFKNNKFSWEEMYEFAEIYFEKNHNLQVHIKFKTNDGYTFDENGIIKLGQWIHTQRYTCDRESNRGYFLDCIGMNWDIHKNKFDVLSLSYDNKIDTKKNRNVLEHISFIEYKVKLLFLKDNNIDIVDENGMLHEIFSMSSINMKLKYSVSLEDLVNMYKEKSK